VQGLALLLALACDAVALTPAELRAMRESAAKAHRLERGRGQRRTAAMQPVGAHRLACMRDPPPPPAAAH